ncbi:uncharacterized protein [Amphiura filiformis]|uniref:uncharacterized protein isoform X2 n=1 Tax=Amphiura filiformis TaxID=82378 RepID=UPI003B211E95
MIFWSARAFVFVVVWMCVSSNTSAQDLAKDDDPTTIPTFLEHPQNASVVNNGKVTLSCKARPAMGLFFKCNEQWVDSDEDSEFEKDHVMHVKLTLPNKDVDFDSGRIWCQCVAWADMADVDKMARSNTAYITKSLAVKNNPPADLPNKDSESTGPFKVITGGNRELFLPKGDSVDLFAVVIPATQPSGEPYKFEWTYLADSKYDVHSASQPQMLGSHTNKLQLSTLPAGEYHWQVTVYGYDSKVTDKINVTVHPASYHNNKPTEIHQESNNQEVIALTEKRTDKELDSPGIIIPRKDSAAARPFPLSPLDTPLSEDSEIDGSRKHAADQEHEQLGIQEIKPIKGNKQDGAITVITGANRELFLPKEDSVDLFAIVVPATQPSGEPYKFEWTILPSSKYGVHSTSQPQMRGSHSNKLQLSKLPAGEYNWQVTVYGYDSKVTDKINVTVHPAPSHPNTPTEIQQEPNNQEVIAPTEKPSEVQAEEPQNQDAVAPTENSELYEPLSVTLGDNKEMQLPDENSVNLLAVVKPPIQPGGKAYMYNWEILPSSRFMVNATHPQMVGNHGIMLQMSKLTAGEYNLKIEVRGDHSVGTAYINVTVHPAPSRINAQPDVYQEPEAEEVALEETEEVAIDETEEVAIEETEEVAIEETEEVVIEDNVLDRPLNVNTGENKDLFLPEEDSVSLFADVIPATQTGGEPYSFEWVLLPTSTFDNYDENSPPVISGRHEQRLQLSKLTAGEYNFQVVVRGDNSNGTDYISVTVHPAPASAPANLPTNTSSVVQDKPANQEVIQVGNDGVIDKLPGKQADDAVVSEQTWMSNSLLPSTVDDLEEFCQTHCPAVNANLTQASTDTLQRKLLLLEIEKAKEEMKKIKLEHEVLLLHKQLLLQQIEN